MFARRFATEIPPMTNPELQAAFKGAFDELEAKIAASTNIHKDQMLAFTHVAHRALSRVERLAHDTGEITTFSGGEPKT